VNGPAWRSPKVPFVPEVVRNALLESRVKTTSLSIVYRSSEDICILVPPSGNCVHRDGTCHVHWYVTDAHDISVSGISFMRVVNFTRLTGFLAFATSSRLS